MKLAKYIIALALTATLCSTAHATRQRPDIVIYDGLEYQMHFFETGGNVNIPSAYPMEQYFEKHLDKRPRGGGISSNLRRGHLATYEVRDGQLFLKDIKIRPMQSRDEMKSVMKDVFPDGKPLKIDWLRGTLRLGSGTAVAWLEIDKGNVKRVEKPKSAEASEAEAIREENKVLPDVNTRAEE